QDWEQQPARKQKSQHRGHRHHKPNPHGGLVAKTDFLRHPRGSHSFRKRRQRWRRLRLLRFFHTRIVILRLAALMAKPGVGRQLSAACAEVRHDYSLTQPDAVRRTLDQPTTNQQPPTPCYLPLFMPLLTLVVIGDLNASHMRLLKQLPSNVESIISDDFEKLKEAAPKADILLNGGFHAELFRKIFPLVTKAQWGHNLSTGVEGILSPEVIASSIPLTNGRGVFSSILA